MIVIFVSTVAYFLVEQLNLDNSSSEPTNEVDGPQMCVSLQHPQLFVAANGTDLGNVQPSLEYRNNDIITLWMGESRNDGAFMEKAYYDRRTETDLLELETIAIMVEQSIGFSAKFVWAAEKHEKNFSPNSKQTKKSSALNRLVQSRPLKGAQCVFFY